MASHQTAGNYSSGQRYDQGAQPTHSKAYSQSGFQPNVAYTAPIRQPPPDELTAEELEAYERGIINWEKARNWRFWFRKEWKWWYVAFVFLVIIVALMAFFHKTIINWLEPFVRKIQAIKYGWLIPVGILFALSFPPLFGNEIVMVLVGLVWGLGIGFAIVAVGIILGEGANYFVFKYLCTNRAKKMTKKSLNYACLSQAIIEGGFVMAWIVRLSVIPTHFTTAVFAVCGLKWYHFFLALILALPKQLLSVYVGVVLGEQNPTSNSHVVSDSVFGVTAVVTIGALIFIYRRMMAVRKKVIIGMRDDLQAQGVKIPDQYATGAFETDAGETSNRTWAHPFPHHAITEPQGSSPHQYHTQPQLQYQQQQSYSSAQDGFQHQPYSSSQDGYQQQQQQQQPSHQNEYQQNAYSKYRQQPVDQRR
ncbi:hypothetical protein BD324DRAFT_439769 [Kockovaella imperatae]|uniref:Golgi apparatus membrane protein TVP38 n=1 Tax=Kockovaella imperatae TaxID=4999 RepID=A0A1Y1UGW5_9TREE|nr:hypothetical protein BD324DRAFT_439769 [Kockovaella imperatae]ORX37300.1 hypothetical protein BD324DRAFT_439769 [Kockovaella imperatae]